MKIKKPRAAAERRAYPKWQPGDSVATYVDQYFLLNTGRKARVYAYDNCMGHTGLYVPLNQAPASQEGDLCGPP